MIKEVGVMLNYSAPTSAPLIWKKLFLGSSRVTLVPGISASYLSASGGTVPWMMMISPGCRPPGMGPVYGTAWRHNN